MISIFLHVVIRTCTCFFSRFLESRKYKIQIVARVGRKSAVVLSGRLEASYSHFFIGRGFESSTARKRRARKICPNKTPIASGVEESNSPRRVLLLLLSNSSGGHHLKKKHMQVINNTMEEHRNRVINSHAIQSQNLSKFSNISRNTSKFTSKTN